jgi:di/tripeptidase
MATMVLALTTTVPTDTDTGMDTAHTGGAGITEVITVAGTTATDIMAGDIMGADTPEDIVAATDIIDPGLRI